MDFQSSVDLHNRIYEQLTNPLGDISAADLSDPTWQIGNTKRSRNKSNSLKMG